MRYFAVMNDGKVITVEDVCEKRYTGNIYFTLDGVRVKYCKHPAYYEDVVALGTSICRRKYFPFYKLMNDEWWVCDDINYIISLDETEDEELNYFQSTDFNAGMLYSAVEKNAVKMLKEGVYSTKDDYSIPNIQLIPKGCETCNEGNTIDATIRATTEHFKAVYGKNLELDIYGWQRNKVYCVFFYRITRKEPCKEMTIAEIEEALGYKIKVVDDK